MQSKAYVYKNETVKLFYGLVLQYVNNAIIAVAVGARAAQGSVERYNSDHG
jgi:hypothetical protein